MTTNITPELRKRFLSMLAGEGNLALFSVFLDGKPTAAIVNVYREEDGGHYIVDPVAVMVTEDIAKRITDHDGVAPEWPQEEQAQDGGLPMPPTRDYLALHLIEEHGYHRTTATGPATWDRLKESHRISHRRDRVKRPHTHTEGA